MPFFVVRDTWSGGPLSTPPSRTRVVAGCSSMSHAEGLAEVEACACEISGRDPDTGAWWTSDGGGVHRIEVTRRWPAR